jgi:hypothetical protein
MPNRSNQVNRVLLRTESVNLLNDISTNNLGNLGVAWLLPIGCSKSLFIILSANRSTDIHLSDSL